MLHARFEQQRKRYSKLIWLLLPNYGLPNYAKFEHSQNRLLDLKFRYLA